MQEKTQYMKNVLEKTSQQLAGIASGEKYAELVEKLLVQSLVALIEEKVEVRCRKGDVNIVKGTFAGAQKSFEAETGKKVQLNLNETDFLPDSCGGGVELRVGGKFRMANTLENRLQLAFSKTLPAIRNFLFGIGNGSRAFFDKEA